MRDMWKLTIVFLCFAGTFQGRHVDDGLLRWVPKI